MSSLHSPALAAELARLVTEVDLMQADRFTQHGRTSCLTHMIAVAWLSMRLMDLAHVQYDRTSLLRGALLHDFFLYDWHTHQRKEGERMHAFTHGAAALRNARQRTRINVREADIIAHHMFPVTAHPPRCREAVAVCLADKLCAVYEALHPDCYKALRRAYAPILADPKGGDAPWPPSA